MWFLLHKFLYQDMKPHKVSILKLLDVKKPEHPYVGTDLTEEPNLQSSLETLLGEFHKSEFLDFKLQRGHSQGDSKESFREEVCNLPDWQLAPWVLQIVSKYWGILCKYALSVFLGSVALGFIGGLIYSLILGCACSQPEEVIELPEKCGRTDQ